MNEWLKKLSQLSMPSIPEIQSRVAPWTTPVPSALAVALRVFNELTPQTIPGLAILGAMAAFVGMETVAGTMSYSLIRLHRQRTYSAEFWVALTGLTLYVIAGTWVLRNDAMFLFFLLSPFAYFGYSILRSMTEEHKSKLDETHAETELVKAQNALQKTINKGRVQPAQSNTERRSTVQLNSEQRSPEQVNKGEQFTKLMNWLNENPERAELPVRTIAQGSGVSTGTVSKYLKGFKDAHLAKEMA